MALVFRKDKRKDMQREEPEKEPQLSAHSSPSIKAQTETKWMANSGDSDAERWLSGDTALGEKGVNYTCHMSRDNRKNSLWNRLEESSDF